MSSRNPDQSKLDRELSGMIDWQIKDAQAILTGDKATLPFAERSALLFASGRFSRVEADATIRIMEQEAR